MSGHRCRAAFGKGMLVVGVLSLLVESALAWGSSTTETDDTVYGNTFTRDWMYDSKSISLKVEGCAWGYVDDSENAGCLQDDSDDGTTNWYMMANCRRPQVVFSVYASSSSSTNCNSNNFVGSVGHKMHSIICLGFLRRSMISSNTLFIPYCSSSREAACQSSFTICKRTMQTSTTLEMTHMVADSMPCPNVTRATLGTLGWTATAARLRSTISTTSTAIRVLETPTTA
jgi:hypothetical protein